MAWTAPPTFSDGSVLTAAQLNAALRDNLNETAPAKATAAGQIFVATGANTIAARLPTAAGYAGGGVDATNSPSYIPLTGGATVTATTGDKAIVAVGSLMFSDTVGAMGFCSYAVSGATAIAAQDSVAIIYECPAANRDVQMSWVTIQPSLNAGSNTFTNQFKSTGGISTFARRNIVVVPL